MERLATHVLGLLSRFAAEHQLEIPPIPSAQSRIPMSLADQCLRTLAEQCPSPAFTLKVAEHWHPSDFGVLGYAWLASSTLHAALERLIRFKRVVGERPSVSLREGEEGVWLAYDHRRDEADMDRWGSELLLALIVTMCRINYGGRLVPLQVSLRYEAPDDPEVYDSFFGCPVRFSASENAFLLSHEVVSKPLDTGHLELTYALDAMLTTQLAAIDKEDLIMRCKAELHRLLPDGNIGAPDLAASLHVSERSLQRKLAERGTSFQALIDEVRKEMACRFLADWRFSVTEIAFLCGFSNSSSFSRAFLRWTGTSPSDWRESLPPGRPGIRGGTS